MEILSVIASVIIAVVFMFASYFVYRNYFYSIIFPLNAATRLFFVAVLFGSGVTLVNYHEAGLLFMKYFVEENKIVTGIGIYSIGLAVCFAFNVLMFRTTLLVHKISLFENEKAELAKGNFLIAGIHTITFLVLIFTLSNPLIQLVLSLIQ
jgi:hypothetical protein